MAADKERRGKYPACAAGAEGYGGGQDFQKDAGEDDSRQAVSVKDLAR